MKHMQSPEITNANYVKAQLLSLIDTRDGSARSKRQIKRHDILRAGKLVGGVSLKHRDDRIHLNVFHKIADEISQKKKVIARTHIEFLMGNYVQIVASTEDLEETLKHFEHLQYAQSAYLPQDVMYDFATSDRKPHARRLLTLDETPELVDFIHTTSTNFQVGALTGSSTVHTGISLQAL